MMPRQEFVTLMVIAMLACLFMAFWLTGCAGPEPRAPIQAYREQFGFTP